MSVIANDLVLPKNYEIFIKPSEIEISQRKLENYRRFCDMVAWGRRNPAKFASDFFGVEMLDFQTWFFMNAWATPHVVLVGGRGIGKTTIDAVFIMTKMVLFSNYEVVICSGTATQSIDSFQKLEKIAKKELGSFYGLTDFFAGNLVANSSSDGFTHNPAGFSAQLYNNSRVRTVNSATDNNRGKRCNLLLLDEVGFMEEEVIDVYSAFTVVDADFKLGANVNLETMPRAISNQILLTSSASAVGTPFWKRYRDYAKRMYLGDKRYFCAHLSAEAALTATYKGKKYSAQLINKEEIDQKMRLSRPQALREYYGIFLSEGTAGQIIKRQWIARNSLAYIPELGRISPDAEYVLCYDPARSNDNSFILVGRFEYDAAKGWTIRIVNGVNFSDLGTRKHIPMRIPEQVKAIRDLWFEYSGKEDSYDNISMFVDGGAGGGGGSSLADLMMEDWYEDGHENDDAFLHPGMIDPEYSREYVRRFPNARKKLTITIPNQQKSLMYESLIQCVENDLIIFPEPYLHKGYIEVLEVDERLQKRAEEELRNQNKNVSDITIQMMMQDKDIAKVKMYKLSPEEEIALTQIDQMKEEIVNICRFKTETSKDRFALPSHKTSDFEQSEATLNDDRAYTLAMMGYALTLRRNEERMQRIKGNQKSKDYVHKLPFTTGKVFRMLG